MFYSPSLVLSERTDYVNDGNVNVLLPADKGFVLKSSAAYSDHHRF
jgi:hypothetical protein